MSFFSSILSKIKEVIRKMIGAKTIESTLNVTPVISSEMENAIHLWGKMYKNKAPWLHEPTDDDPTRIVSLGLPALIASEKARTALLEFKSEITTPTKEVEVKNPDYTEPKEDIFGNIIPSMQPETITEDRPIGDTKRAEFLNEQYEKLKGQLRKQLEYGIAKGGLVIKPYVVFTEVDEDGQNNDGKQGKQQDKKPAKKKAGKEKKEPKKIGEIEFDFIQADWFYPIAFDASGNITEAAFVEPKIDKEKVYYRVEYHAMKNNRVTVINKAFVSNNQDAVKGNLDSADLGKEIPLAEVPEWKDLPAKVVIGPVSKPLFAYFKMPEANTIDVTSPLGVSGYSRAVNLIKDADIQYSRLLWEYEGGEMAIDIDRNALQTTVDKKGNAHTEMNHLQKRLFRFVDISQTGDTYYPYAPSLRDANYNQGLNTILMRIEDAVGLSRGSLSDVSQEARTATEIKILKQRSFQTNADIQHATENCLKDAIYVMNVHCDLYNLTPPGDYDVSFEWDDSILVDVETELNKRITLMQNGICSKLEVRMWYFGETERQAQEALTKIDEEAQSDMEQGFVANQNNEGNPFDKKKDEDKEKEDDEE